LALLVYELAQKACRSTGGYNGQDSPLPIDDEAGSKLWFFSEEIVDIWIIQSLLASPLKNAFRI